MIRRLGSALRREVAGGVPAQVATAALVCVSVLVLSTTWGSTRFFAQQLAATTRGWRWEQASPCLYWFACSVVLFGVVPCLAASLTPGLRVRDTGVGLGDWRSGLAVAVGALALLVPLVFVASRAEAFAAYYPLCAGALASNGSFVVYEVAYAGQIIAWEYLFRGYLLSSFARSMGRGAIYVQMIPFVLMHIDKPVGEALGAVVTGLLLGVLALRTRSFWYGAIIHVGAAVMMDVMVSFF